MRSHSILRRIVAIALIACAPMAAHAGANGLTSLATPVPHFESEVIPSTVRTYSSPEAIADEPLALPQNATRVSFDLGVSGGFRLYDGGEATSGWKKWAPVGMSLLVPGAGEIYMGYYWRGAALVAAEVLAWTGYIVNTDNGNQAEVEYRYFASTHWAEDKWINDHNAFANFPGEKTYEALDSIGSDPSYDGWPGYHIYTPVEENAINFYENIGKYDWFISGWSDWDPTLNPMDTDLRTQYKAMRKESDDYHDRAHKFVYLSIAARAFSLVETTILVQKGGKKKMEQASGPAKELKLKTRANGWMGGEVALEYRF